MTEQERHDSARAKAQKLVDWFEERPLPITPFKINKFSIMINFEQAIAVSSARVLNCKPYSTTFLSCYNHLLTYKKYIESEQIKTDNR